MLINRNNYESFFLLYVDGELCAADRKATEDFTAANPDLQEELNFLMDTVLLPEPMKFVGKSSLYKAVIIDDLMQESLLLLVDDELKEKEKAATAGLIAERPEVALEYASLLLTKSDPTEKIIYPDKHLLYRKEKDNVLIGRFTRWCVAAALLGFGLFFGIKLVRENNPSEPMIAKGRNIPLKETGSRDIPASDGQSHLTNNNEEKQALSSGTVLQKNSNTVKIIPADKKLPGGKPAEEKSLSTLADKIAVQPAVETQKYDVPNEPTLKIIPESQTLIAAVTEVNKLSEQGVNNIVSPEHTYAKAVAFNEEERSGNKILYMDEDDVKRSKAGGIFRKIKRFVERTAKIKTGNSLKIAGFEFAAK